MIDEAADPPVVTSADLPGASWSRPSVGGDPRSRRVLVLYTGGTIGMVAGPQGYRPEPGFLARRLAAMPQFHDPTEEELTLPVSRYGLRVHYRIAEADQLVDSSDMDVDDWVKLAREIEAAYEAYDAFVVLHGTDTMAYTASALSFMLEGLNKSVILTGSQVPLAEVVNDAVENLLGALTLAGHFDIPEVTIFFDQMLLRGNRAQKVDARGFGAFDSGNCRPLARISSEIEVGWDRVLAPRAPFFSVEPITVAEVACLRLFPGIRADLVANVLRPPTRGLVLETFGTGNLPSNRPDLLDVIREAVERGVVVVNCTQCHRGSVKPSYAAGASLYDLGVLPAADMTPEAALTKLAWLLSLGITLDEVEHRFQKDQRGEMTVPKSRVRFSFREKAFVNSVAQMLTQQGGDNALEHVGRALYPVLLCAAARLGDETLIDRLLDTGVNPSEPDYDGRTALHVAASAGQLSIARRLIDRGASLHREDTWGHTPLDEAIRAGEVELAEYFRGLGAIPTTG